MKESQKTAGAQLWHHAHLNYKQSQQANPAQLMSAKGENKMVQPSPS